MLYQEHRQNPQFGSMLLSLTAFSLTQPVGIYERTTLQSRATQARLMIHEAITMRSLSNTWVNPTIEAVLTSFFLFCSLFGINEHESAWSYLKDALDLAATLGINDPSPHHDLSRDDEKGQRLRIYLVLFITERYDPWSAVEAYTLQYRHLITGPPAFIMRPMHSLIGNTNHVPVSRITICRKKDANEILGLVLLMQLFLNVDEDFVTCWDRQCGIDSGYCGTLTEEKALIILKNLNNVSMSEWCKAYIWSEYMTYTGDSRINWPASELRETQYADIFITKKWLQNRVWILCLNHGLVKPMSDHHELSSNYCMSVAKDALRLCRSLRPDSIEVHGIGMVEKLYDIAISAISMLSNAQCSFQHKPPLVSPVEAVSNPGVSQPEGFKGSSETGAAIDSPAMAKDFLLLLSSLHGGDHPFLERYKAFLGASQGAAYGTTGHHLFHPL
ncbi:fungal specific transcription factor domain-containing protein [Aspergillus alliaceus]|uniref:fungal specific transcription factor domain-containing protein n=1 Tax=Petromyces alliaceus TaxID=209559 RepID=UPI0012A7416B|nr:uncharacterized protein BDW43DRAFT_314911 [Aspergillus alliaceus]KAB8229520.1 hypothetical protein BDW43DRAFT_314911 [Aspergillus alliaceus]